MSYKNEIVFPDGHKIAVETEGAEVWLYLNAPSGPAGMFLLPREVASALHMHLGAALKGMGQ